MNLLYFHHQQVFQKQLNCLPLIEISKRSILSEPCAQVGVLAPMALNPYDKHADRYYLLDPHQPDYFKVNSLTDKTLAPSFS